MAAATTTRPTASMFVDLVNHRYRLNANAESIRGSAMTAKMNQAGSMSDKDVGSALDVIVGFRNILGVRGFGADIRAGWFFPGDAFRTDAGGGATHDADTGMRIIGKFFF